MSIKMNLINLNTYNKFKNWITLICQQYKDFGEITNKEKLYIYIMYKLYILLDNI